MKRDFGVLIHVTCTGAFLICFTLLLSLASAEDQGSGPFVPEGTYLKLTREFYRALREEGDGSARVYSNSAENEYLRQMSVSSRFMVETNLQIIKQQERMIRLLQEILKRSKK
ncbi:MAG: hypothetical protein JRF59_07340 [Deltaproteobacteria bacterium]|nr:hypothetical protein [Deltaproteobacteria bacterium]MBW1924622.1 hypothetical protein [Deltaproteobacteria bacterium]MBW1949120.1 hypothetical protein [Deltaproteobacteria bacterium]MBW2007409.1 hypothetical protein [Deltaproteobacteria bacterium]MBW2101280.1 hypothetical protein [Deltaproteobacteria bacterium]